MVNNYQATLVSALSESLDMTLAGIQAQQGEKLWLVNQ